MKHALNIDLTHYVTKQEWRDFCLLHAIHGRIELGAMKSYPQPFLPSEFNLIETNA